MVTQKQRSDTTRALLLKATRESLLNHGLEATTTASILSATGLSKGALYHHFQSKTEIVEAIYASESSATIKRALESVGATTSPLARLREACIAWLYAVQDRDVAQILFVIGPEALGLIKAKQIEDSNSLTVFEALLREADAAGEIELDETTLAARLLNALMAEAALASRSMGQLDALAIGRAIDGVVAALAKQS